MSIDHETQQRQRALNPQQSFIVQAPAGSGKTELLTQRILTLLAEAVDQPEEILAITFTRKAAAEMHSRIMQALQSAESDTPPTEAHKKITWALARQVRQRNAEKQWHLLQNPNRLRLMTIDSLFAYLAQQLPIAAQLGGALVLTEQPDELYQQACELLLFTAQPGTPVGDALVILLQHLDNRAHSFIQLLMQLLRTREQWLASIMQARGDLAQLRTALETTLTTIIEAGLQRVIHHLPYDRQTLYGCLRAAGAQLRSDHGQHRLALLADLPAELTANPEHLPFWQAISHCLLTQTGHWRKSLDKRSGFIAKSTTKQQALEWLQQQTAHSPLQQALYAVQQLPDATYHEPQWHVLSALLTVLPLLCAQLRVVMQQHGKIDFNELSLSALQALGTSDQPTDLALRLDYQFKHILIDEFQDTSTLQWQILQKIVAEWPTDGSRTLFLVGDPMQSIYRFRNAKVSLFAQACEQGIGPLSLEVIQLRRNYRSSAQLIEWFNQQFSTLFPAEIDQLTGAIPYHASQSPYEPAAAAIHHTVVADRQQQGQQLAHIITHIPEQESIAILVRARSQLMRLLPALQQADIAYQAIDIMPLDRCAEIIDCLSLTRALWHLADDVAWLAVWRAPWCGLSLQDIFSLQQSTAGLPLSHVMTLEIETLSLSDDGRQRVQRCWPILHTAIQQRGRLPWDQLIKATWLQLGGIDCLTHATELANCERYFSVLANCLSTQPDLSLSQWQQELARRFVEPKVDDARVQVMTIHKAKGLEFDHVILPDLNYQPKASSNPLLYWLQLPAGQHLQPLLAPLSPWGQDSDPIYTHCQSVERQAHYWETIRLLYVATTRAKQHLHCLLHLSTDEEKAVKPPLKLSFADLLWPQAQSIWSPLATTATATEQGLPKAEPQAPVLSRLPDDYQQTGPTLVTTTPRCFAQPVPLERHSSIDVKRLQGTLIHQSFERISLEGLAEWENTPRLVQARAYWRSALQVLRLTPTAIAEALSLIEAAVVNTLNHPTGRWILNNQHPVAYSEYALAGWHQQKWQHIVIDRFIVTPSGELWLIDYKTGQPAENEDKNAFIAGQVQRYRDQLQHYAEMVAQRYSHPLRLALYFPLCDCHLIDSATAEILEPLGEEGT